MEPDGHLSDLPIDHGLSLAFHHGPQIIKFFDFAFFRSLIPIFPFLNFRGQILISLLFGLILLLEGKVDIVEFVLEHLIFMVEGLTDFVQFFILLPVLVYFLFLDKTFFGELSDLYFVVGGIEELAFIFFEFDSEDLNFLG